MCVEWVVWDLPVRRLLFSQQVSILRGMRVLDIRGILPNQCSCLLKTMSWIGLNANFIQYFGVVYVEGVYVPNTYFKDFPYTGSVECL